MTDIKSKALEAVADGFKVFPVYGITEAGGCACASPTCESPGKHPAVRGWQRAATDDLARIDEWDWSNRNYGMLADGFLIVDIDGIEGEQRWDQINLWEEQDGTPLPSTRTVKTPNGMHVIFSTDKILGPKVGLDEQIDIRAGNSYVVGPGSTHASGQVYVSNDMPIALAPDSLVQWAKGRRETTGEEYENILEATKVGKGGRDNYLASVAGVFRKRGATEEELYAILHYRNQTVCDPPLPEADIKRIAKSIAQHSPDFDLIEAAVAEEKREERATNTDILSFRDLLELPEPTYVIDEVWPEGGVNVLFGEPGSFKSFLALDWALTRATGLPWHGRKVKPGAVLYVAAEGVYGMGARAQAWAEERQLEDVPNFWMKRGAYNLLDETTFNYIRQVIQVNDIDLIVYDTLRKSMTGGDENSTVEVGIMMSRLEDLSNELDTDSLLIHHTNKQGGFRGSTAIHGDAYNMWELKKGRATGSLSVKLSPHKFKDAPDNWALEMTMEERGGSLIIGEVREARDDQNAVSANEERENAEAVAISFGLSERQLEIQRRSDAGESVKHIADEMGLGSTTVSRERTTIKQYEEHQRQMAALDNQGEEES